MSVTAASGFRAAGVAAGVKASGDLDVALIVNDGPSSAAAGVFTSNRARAHPVLWSAEALKGGSARAVVLNSGGANCFTGAFGFQTTHQTAERAAEHLGIGAIDVQVASTGLIGVGDETFRAAVLHGVGLAADALTETGGAGAARAIMTTDSVPKEATYSGDGWVIGGMAKGAGMLAPALATMLVVLTTDADASAEMLDRALRAAASTTFDRLDSDGCMSTNDSVWLLASGASGVAVDEAALTRGVYAVCDDLARQLQADAEGATHDIDIEVRGAATEADAVAVGRAVARSNLLKTAITGNDPNWGRVLAAVGTTDAAFDPFEVDVSFNGVRLCHRGAPDRPREETDLTPRQTSILIELHAGNETATIRTNDLTAQYVHENSAYAS